MTLYTIAASVLVALLIILATRNQARTHLLLGVSTLAVYAFQPSLPIRGLDFWLPTATLGITATIWGVTSTRESRSWKKNAVGMIILLGIVLLLSFTRYLKISLPFTASRPPQPGSVAISVAFILLIVMGMGRFGKTGSGALVSSAIAILLIFIILKFPPLTELASVGMRSLGRQSTSLANANDIQWLGFSYIAFRLLHTLRDRQSGRLPDTTLAEFMVFVVFFPALTAGPIDRIQRFLEDLRRPTKITANDAGEAGKRLMLGLFKKFVIADTLSMLALNADSAIQVSSPGWAWLLLYAYAFQIFFDFSGYTDIAIGLGRLLGFKLPENFNAPYLKANLTQFWNNWHMSLTQWFRAYFFNPFTRVLRSQKKPLPVPLIILITQVSTMVLIGLWHGMTINFVIWGLWHGLGLFVHNRWSEKTRGKFTTLHPRMQVILNGGGALLTFNFVSLGWIFFALPDSAISFRFLSMLFGLGYHG